LSEKLINKLKIPSFGNSFKKLRKQTHDKILDLSRNSYVTVNRGCISAGPGWKSQCTPTLTSGLLSSNSRRRKSMRRKLRHRWPLQTAIFDECFEVTTASNCATKDASGARGQSARNGVVWLLLWNLKSPNRSVTDIPLSSIRTVSFCGSQMTANNTMTQVHETMCLGQEWIISRMPLSCKTPSAI